MRCPFCGSIKDKVIDSRSTKDDCEIRRRRECEDCGGRFTTYERIEEIMPVVKKKNGEREPYDRNKIKKGLMISCQKRPVSAETIDQMIVKIERSYSPTKRRKSRRVLSATSSWRLSAKSIKSLSSASHQSTKSSANRKTL